MHFLFLSLLHLLLFLPPGDNGALSPELTERIRALSLEGFESAYNFDFAAANRSFDEASKVEPLHPRPYVGKAMIEMWKYLLTKNDTARQAFLALADKAIDAAEHYEDRYGENAELKLCLGTIYGYRAFVYGRAKSYLKAAWDGKKSFDYYNDALGLDPKTYDAYLGLGVYHYFLDFLPKPFRWIASMMGISGDAGTGMRELRLAAEKGVYGKIDAQYYLAQFTPWVDGDFDSGEHMLSDLASRYPGNNLLSFTLAVWELRENDVRPARDRLAAIVASGSDPLGGVMPYAMYKLACCYFSLGAYDDARRMYQSFLHGYHEGMYRATSNYHIGLCFELAGRRDSAIGYYRKALRTDRKFGDDAYASRRAGLLVNAPLSPADTLLIAAGNALHTGAYDEAIEAASRLASSAGVPGDVALQAEFLRGESYFWKKSYAEALPRYRAAAAQTPAAETWLLPWSHYQSGLCLLKMDDASGALEEFRRAQDYDEYDFHNWLEFRIKREIEKIEKSSKP
jgi:tetratricopeptide (TPR) repeat protein